MATPVGLRRQRDAVDDGMFAAVRRLRWSADRLAAEREQRLRALLSWSLEHSAFHRRRLQGVDSERFTEADLSTLPPMTKDELMADFDQVVTDPRLRLDEVDDFVDNLDNEGRLLHDEFRVIATGGSSGRRGVFVYGWEDWITFATLTTRWQVRLSPQVPIPPNNKVASVFAKKASHISGALHAFFQVPGDPVCHLPITLPLERIVDGLNRAQPQSLRGYPTAVGLLAGEADAGRLTIPLSSIQTCGELLTDDVRRAAADTWGVDIEDCYGATEGLYAYSCHTDLALHLPDDLVIVEPVDHEGQPVPPGQPAAKILVTNLYNRTQPLIRYELTDAMTVLDTPCACGCAHRRITDLGGRLDDIFTYPGGAVAHTVGFYGAMLRARHVIEYQIRQTAGGVDVTVRTDGTDELAALRDNLRQTLSAAGLVEPTVNVREASTIDRLWSGKLRRFVPLGAA